MPGAKPLFIAIAGGTGSGKTTLAQRIAAALPGGVVIIEHDWYYRDRSHVPPNERLGLNYDEPAALDNELLARDLAALRAGEAVECPLYDFATHTRSSRTERIEPA